MVMQANQVISDQVDVSPLDSGFNKLPGVGTSIPHYQSYYGGDHCYDKHKHQNFLP
jgi:hypothetical protein